MPTGPQPNRPLRDDPQKEIGYDNRLIIGGDEYAVTNVSYSAEANTSEQQFSTGMGQSIVTTGMSYSGSFEHTGSNEDLRGAVRQDNGLPVDPNSFTLRVEEHERTVIFRGVIISSRDKDVPSDDRTSESYDFVAEEMVVKTN